jgi:flagellar basal-body rod protein FlgC
MDLQDSITISGSGMQAQSARLRIIAQNMANEDSTATTPGGDPYRRKTISFANVLDQQMGVEKVTVAKTGEDMSPFHMKYDPGHPAAGADGYVKYPNVDPVVEMVDMREAERSYEANLNSIAVARSMIQQTLGLLK